MSVFCKERSPDVKGDLSAQKICFNMIKTFIW